MIVFNFFFQFAYNNRQDSTHYILANQLRPNILFNNNDDDEINGLNSPLTMYRIKPTKKQEWKSTDEKDLGVRVA
ncbi:hypothetical protein DERP_010502 [Dermatophagoides pteronyssinus]|uniref:Uncharacterized protein n=1 Tax=Dermatophagoides pteronyssinus TaxID=6956 RepID=A0ABQ8JG29_DERPT|nr:hypothetical protein DERP_010502 [Dermatophagoides pteronyssinus]